MKVLVNCYACSPYQGSEPGMGWNFVKCLSRLHVLHIITELKFKADLDRYFEEHPEDKPFFQFYFIEKNRHKKLRKIWPPSYYWFYKAWQKKAYKLAMTLDEKENFDIIHQLNMVGYREPGYLWKLDKLFVWGPIGGFGITPWRMLPSMGLNGCVYYFSRNILNIFQSRYNRRVRMAMLRATSLIAATQTQKDYINKLYGRDSVIVPEVGCESLSQIICRKRDFDEKLKVCWCGQHIPCKSLNLLLDAMSILNRDDIELHVIGEGSETNRWRKHAQRLGLNNIMWYGQVERDRALDIMRKCHLFCITSLSDLTSTVLLEALSCGLPVIALDHCGFSNVITDECGRKIPIKNAKQVVKDLSFAINELADDESLRLRLAEGALRRAKDYNWEDKAKIITEIYETISV